MNFTYDHSQANNGFQSRAKINLANEKVRKFVVSPNILNYTSVSVEIACTECTGTSGNVKIYETNTQSGASGAVNHDTTQTVALGVNSRNIAKVSNVLTSHISLEFGVATIGATGVIEVIITAKR